MAPATRPPVSHHGEGRWGYLTPSYYASARGKSGGASDLGDRSSRRLSHPKGESGSRADARELPSLWAPRWRVSWITPSCRLARELRREAVCRLRQRGIVRNVARATEQRPPPPGREEKAPQPQPEHHEPRLQDPSPT